jgi:spore maturation protein CgeB
MADSYKSFRALFPKTFDRNWDALHYYHPECADTIRKSLSLKPDQHPELKDLPPLQEISDILIDQNQSIMIVSHTNQIEIVNPTLRETFRNEIHNNIQQYNPKLLLLLSTGDLSGIQYCQQSGFTNQSILIAIEKYVLLFLASLAISDCTQWLSNPNIRFSIGENYPESLQNSIYSQALFIVNPKQIVATNSSGFFSDNDRQEYQNNIQSVLGDCTLRNQQFQQNYQKCVISMNQLPSFNEGQTPKIWGYTVAPYRMQYSIHVEMMKSLFQGFSSAGWDAHLCIIPCERWSTRLKLLHEIVSFNPDIVFFLNTDSEPFFHALFGHSNLNRYRWNWLVDEYSFSTIGDGENLRQLDHVYAMDPAYVDRLSSRDLGALHYLPVAASIDSLGTPRPEYSHSLSFVGSVVDLTENKNLLNKTDRDWIEEKINAVLSGELLSTAIPETQIGCSRTLIQHAEAYAASVRKPHLKSNRAIRYWLSVEANTRKRVQTMIALHSMNIQIYGPKDWLQLLPTEMKQNYHGPVAFHDLPDLFASSTINLNLHSLQCPTSLNPRDFDILAAGGFLLSDYVNESDSGYLIPEHDAVFYKDQSDLLTKTAYYLEHEDERQQIARQGHQTAMQKGLLKHRAKQMIEYFLKSL